MTNTSTFKKTIIRISIADNCQDNENIIAPESDYKEFGVSFVPVNGNIADQSIEAFMNEVPISEPEHYLFSVYNEDGTEIEPDLLPQNYNMTGNITEI